MNKYCSVNFENRTLVVSRYFLKKASVPFSEEYEMFVRLTKQHPDFNVTVRITASRRPQFMPTYDKMIDYIHRQDNAEELMEEFNETKQIGKVHRNAYMYTRRWFLMRFPEMGQVA